MAQNDIVLLDSLVEKSKERLGKFLKEQEHFDLFVFEQLFKNYDLSHEELKTHLVDGGNDGGIDGFFVFLDGILIENYSDFKNIRKNPTFDIYIITVRHADTFQQQPLNSLSSSIPEIFDLSKTNDNLNFVLDEEILELRGSFREIFLDIQDKYPSLNIHIIYACRGDSENVHHNVSSVGTALKENIVKIFSDCNTEMVFIGATELLQLARKERTYNLKLKFIEHISPTEKDFIVLCNLSEYFNFIKDEKNNLRRYLFESNVRDLVVYGRVNQEILDTLTHPNQSTYINFWWLNNGITLLASNARPAGKELTLENVQIVNGLQTTEMIYKYFSEIKNQMEDRSLLIKIIVSENDETRDQIIKATNNQSPVETGSLYATDKIQKDIDQFLLEHKWYYDRKKNYYQNLGHPYERIISMSYLAASIRALVLKDPFHAQTQKHRWWTKPDNYKTIFDKSNKLEFYVSCINLTKAVEAFLEKSESIRKPSKLKFFFAYFYVVQKQGTENYDLEEFSKTSLPEPYELEEIKNTIDKIRALDKPLTPLKKLGPEHFTPELIKKITTALINKESNFPLFGNKIAKLLTKSAFKPQYDSPLRIRENQIHI